MTASLDPVSKNIEDHGWAVVNVEESAALPPYSYSVGLFKTYSHPEVIVFGLAAPTLQQIINTIGVAVKAGRSFDEVSTSDKVLSGFKCAFRPVPGEAASALMGLAVTYYGSPVPAIHCIWPDREGRFPWDAGATADYRRLQPALSEGIEESTSVIRPSDLLS